MKKLITIIFIFIISITATCFSGCSNNSLPAIDMLTYFKPSVSTTVFRGSLSSSQTINLSLLTSSKPLKSEMDKYLEFTFSANANWIYKMYIEKVEFYVLSNESSDIQMSLNFSMTNLAKENNLSSTSTFEELKSHTPVSGLAQKYTFYINQVVPKATGSTITIDILESSELISNNSNPDSDFKWLIYGFKIYGESREYSK